MPIVSAVQFKPDLAKDYATVKLNLRKLSKFESELDISGTELVVYPELTCQGYNHLDSDSARTIACLNDSGVIFEYFAQLASKLDAHIAYGFLEQLDEKLYNSANLLDNNGNLVYTHRKRSLWGNDFLWASSHPNEITFHETSIGDVSLAICKDIEDSKERGSFYANNGFTATRLERGRITCGLCNWNTSGFPHNSWMEYVNRNRSNLIISNTYGKEVNDGYVLDFGQGGVCIVDLDHKVSTNKIQWGSDCVVTTRLT